MSRRPTIAFVDRDPPSGFMKTDLALLEERFTVERIVYPGSQSASWLLQCLRAARRCDLVYAFFASEHALIPAIAGKGLGRRFLLIPAGYDYANLPEHGYGLAARGQGWLPRLLGRLADHAMPISEQSLWEFVAQVPSAAPRTSLGYLAVDPTSWTDPGVPRDPDLVVTLGYIDDEAYERKGIDRFVAASVEDHDRRYVLAGRVTPTVAARVSRMAGSNLECVGHLGHNALRELFWSAGVYAQFSWHETFGVAMAESMLCGCIPVIHSSPALQEVAGSWAVVTGEHERDASAIARAAVLGRSIDRDSMAADIAERFSLDRRRISLIDAVERSLA